MILVVIALFAVIPLLGLMTFVHGSGQLPLLVTGLVVASGGMSLPMPLLTNIILGAAPPEKAGSAASLSETGGEFGIAVGVASLGTLGTVVYRHQLAGNLPGDVPASARVELDPWVGEHRALEFGLGHQQRVAGGCPHQRAAGP